MRETDHLLNAVRFLTVLPVPGATSECAQAMPDDWLARAIKYFPLVGICIGLMSAIILVLAGKLFGSTIAALLAVATSIIVTSALHEDGLADTFDGFGGGWTPDKRLAIMKDSRIGTYGALALGLGTALRVAALTHLSPSTGAAALIAAHAAARATPAIVMIGMRYAGEPTAMKIVYGETKVQAREFAWIAATVVVAMIPLALLSPASVAAGALCGSLIALAMARWAQRSIGGYTGDVLGSIEQLFEIGFLLAVTAFSSPPLH